MNADCFMLPPLPKPGTADYHGGGSYVLTVPDADPADYSAYVQTLEARGFAVFADNGPDGLYGAVDTCTLTQENLCVQVTYLRKPRRMTVSFCMDRPLSPRLHDCPENHLPAPEGAQARLWQRELWRFGSSYVFQLKNGHFVLSDAGLEPDGPYLLEFLEAHAPAGEKPTVDGWFISHGHADHVGALGWLYHNREQASRLAVEGIYYNEPNDAAKKLDSGSIEKSSWVFGASQRLWTSAGTRPEVYRPQTGQTYYFYGLRMEILHAQEQLPRERFSRDFNDSTTWCMACLEGQRCLLTGDGCTGGHITVMETYDPSVFDVEFMTVPHHGFNTRNDFTQFCRVKTALVSLRDIVPARRIRENEYLKASVQEWFPWGEGTREFTFPYQVGQSRLLPLQDWHENADQQRPEQPNLHTCPQSRSICLTADGLEDCAEAFCAMVSEYGETAFSTEGMPVRLELDAAMAPGTCRFAGERFGWRILAPDKAAMTAACRVFLAHTRWSEDNLIPLPPMGVQQL